MRRDGPASALSPQLALTGFGVNAVLFPIHFQAKAVHHARGQQPVDGQFQQQGQQGQQGLGPGCRARQSCVGWEQGWRVYGQGAGVELEQGHVGGAGNTLAGSGGEDSCLSGTG